MGKTGTTDVLSFPAWPPQKKIKDYEGQFLGDILVSLDQAHRQAEEYDQSLFREVVFLTLHSILHLLGHDHAEEDERKKMQKLENQIWKNLYPSLNDGKDRYRFR